MITFGEVASAVFVRRDNRFRAVVAIEGRDVPVHVPNSGRLAELLLPGVRCLVAPARQPQSRRTGATLQLVEHPTGLVCINAHMANALFEDAWRRDALGEPFGAYRILRREVFSGESRLDFLFSRPEGQLWVEIKCVTLVGDSSGGTDDGLARFPDAPTTRGTRHVQELTNLASRGQRAAVVFVVQRSDARSFTAHSAMDPPFAEALRSAASAGVDIRCFGCIVSQEGMAIDRELPVIMRSEAPCLRRDGPAIAP
ncbi:DNA/RNA nuclease SfsA [Candidatus Fermentibacteria bacterium]|nr:DNA/RNA nuclease SfsA [Candidatus Fermentibacteria bacterium]